MYLHGWFRKILAIICSISLLFQQEACFAAPTPDCKTTCGEMEIPYPFGIDKGCYLSESFRIVCDEVSGSAALAWLNWEVDSISILDHTFRHKNYTSATRRFDKAGATYVDYAPPVIGSHYSLSHSRNTFIAMGCDFFVYLVDEETSKVQGSCSSLCNLNQTLPVQEEQLLSCSGLNCCQISFPTDLRNMSVRVQTTKSLEQNQANKCWFLAFVDNELLRLNKIKVSACNESYTLPMIHEWAVGNAYCNEARKRGDYLCGENTECINYTTGIGQYRCQCSNGFRGNPYFPQGCQDIDECVNPSDNHCPSKTQCVNTAGSYFCLPNRKRTMALIVPLGTGLAVGILFLAAIAIWTWRKLKAVKAQKLKQKLFKRNGGLILQQQISSNSGSVLPELTIFKIEELEKATDRFSKTRIVGKGGLGTVYKGMLSNGLIVAVKKANTMDNTSQVNQFINEVFILSQINHRHIVKLYGCCLETENPLLVYEYIPNGTLSHHLHTRKENESTFSWEDRLRIAAEVAGALAYLHSSATTAIFHRDVKPSNILLDQNYKAVLSDFGLSRAVTTDKTHVTTVVGGTFGYMDPQYFHSGRLKDKSDVYAFGVVVAEMLTGERAVSDDDLGLAFRFRSALKEKRLLEILERSVVYEGEEGEIMAVAKLAKRCLKMKADQRPRMSEVAAELERGRRRRRNNCARESAVSNYNTQQQQTTEPKNSNKSNQIALITDR